MEAWEREHRELYGDDGKPTKKFFQIDDSWRTECRAPWSPIRVSEKFDEYVQAVEAAAMAVAKAQDRGEMEDAYSVLCLAREYLYKYVEKLEVCAKKRRTVLKRFT